MPDSASVPASDSPHPPVPIPPPPFERTHKTNVFEEKVFSGELFFDELRQYVQTKQKKKVSKSDKAVLGIK